MERHEDYVLKTVEDRGVQLIRLWFPDVHGQLKSFALPSTELEHAFRDGMHFDGSSIDGFSRIQESDVIARPDASSFELLPWSSASERAGAMFCDIQNPDGAPFEGDSRHVLRRHLEKVGEAGFRFMVAPEMEYFLFASGDPERPPEPLDQGGYFDLTTADVASDVRRRTLATLEQMGIPVEYSFHEDSPSQHEIDLRYNNALSMADDVMVFRLLVREIAQESGVHATFMPKPIADVQGSGMHTHLSLWRGDENAFFDPDAEYHLSAVARQFIAGVLHHAREITAVTNQLVNSYKRFVVGTEAPAHVSWARNNRSALIRVPLTREREGSPDESLGSSTRIEYRAPDPACNPYLAFAVMLAAGMSGIENEMELVPEASSNLFSLRPEELAAEGIVELPRSLGEALDEMERSELLHEVLGDHIFEWFLRNKRAEWDAYRMQVTPFELRRYLPVW